jgi:hypothetical protein
MTGQNRKRRIIEIYFVLYLAALVLLLTSREKKQVEFTEENNLTEIPFGLNIEKNSLNAILETDSAEVRIVSVDTVNRIYYTGNVADIDLEFSITDELLRSRSVVRGDNPDNRLFEVSRYPDEQMAIFKWKPVFEGLSNQSYTIVVNATGTDTESGALVSDIAQFSMNIIYRDSKPGGELIARLDTSTVDTNEILRRFEALSGPKPNIIFEAYNSKINALSHNEWTNIIKLHNIRLPDELMRNPIAKMNVADEKQGGSVSYRILPDKNEIELFGKAPYYGKAEVVLSLKRQPDGEESEFSFPIEVRRMSEPEYTNVIYPGRRWEFVPNLPSITGRDITSELVDDAGKTYARNNTGSAFTYEPALQDTGKTLYFVRKIDGKLVGERHSVQIRNFREPVIERVSRSGDEKVRIFTRSHGLHEGDYNYVAEIEIVSGNARVKEIFGRQKPVDRQEMEIEQEFEITPKNPDNPFRFKIRAVASNGAKSQVKSWPE